MPESFSSDSLALEDSVMAGRAPTFDEARLLRALAEIAGEPAGWVDALRVEDMNDGGMGSLRVLPGRESRRGGIRCTACVQFTDEDGIEVIASLYASAGGTPFELDVWKTDFSAVIRIADEFRKVVEV